MTGSGEITKLLRDARDGDEEAFDRLWPLVYDEVMRIAHARLREERPGHTLHAPGLAHEAYLKLVSDGNVEWRSRAQFYSICARVMRQILVDHARKRKAQKRGGDWRRTTLSGKALANGVTMGEIIDLDDALSRLEERQRNVVELKFFGGMTEREIADVLDVSKRTVQRDWVKARAWLYRELYPANRA